MTLRIEQVFISRLPLAGQGRQNKQKRIEQVIKLAKQIQNEHDQVFVLTGLLISKIFILLKDEPHLTDKEIADRFLCDEEDVAVIRKMYP